MTVDRASLAADSRGVAHVTVRVTDAQGHPVPDADQTVTFGVSGPGRLIGVDSGDRRATRITRRRHGGRFTASRWAWYRRETNPA